ncbi:MAG: hypothetical protein IJE70_01205 [Oscillospiraceae bacterium]|nr:hypothetical protein [Oscillospiraceae bacterium]MBQ6902343.1 hypothetical protein [Oscillospiraceae bacterium]
MKKAFLIITAAVLCAIMCMGLTSCSKMNKTPDEAKILADYNAKYEHSAYVNFNEIEISRSQLNKEDMRFTADVVLTGKDTYANYTTTCTVTYNYYNDQGWMLDSCSDVYVTHQCFQGMTKDDIEQCHPVRYTNWPTAIYKGTDFNQQANMQYFYFDSRMGDLIQAYCTEVVAFKYQEGMWKYIDTKRTEERIAVENTTWVCYRNSLVSAFPPEITIVSVDENNNIQFKYGNKMITAFCYSTDSLDEGFCDFKTTDDYFGDRKYMHVALRGLDDYPDMCIDFRSENDREGYGLLKYKLKE